MIYSNARRRRLTGTMALWLFVLCLSCSQQPAEEPVLLGADRVLEAPYRSWFEEQRIGLVTNQTGTDRNLTPSSFLLSRVPGASLQALFGPEHGIAGTAQAGESVSSSSKVFSLYGDQRRPTKEMLADIDVLTYDIQDVGARFYTYISTLLECMRAAAEQGIPFIVLDRPNPIGGSRVSGPVLEAGFESFVGTARIPIRYGMTVGEIALFLKDEAELDLDLRIVPLKGWKRSFRYSDTGLHWIAPSPNMPTAVTAQVYPGSCLVEGTSLSEGRGTTHPFELIGAPWLNAAKLADRLNSLGLTGVHFRYQAFTPQFSKYRGELCQGVQIHVLDPSVFEPVSTTLHLLREVSSVHPDDLRFKNSFFDRLAGNDWIRELLLEGEKVETIVERWQADLEQFKIRRSQFLIY